MLGTSLPYSYLKDGGAPFDRYEGLTRADLFRRLSDAGVRSIELRTVRPGEDPAAVLAVADELWNAGFSITVHVAVKHEDNAAEEAFGPLSLLIPEIRKHQKDLIVVVHPIKGDNRAMLLAFSDCILASGWPVRIALENNRFLPDGSEGDVIEFVTGIVSDVARDNVGICFDMGHYYSNLLKASGGDEDVTVPPAPFLKRVIHTHIHAAGPRTHFPLTGYPLPVCEYCQAMSFAYFGVYNLELDFPRFADLCDPLDALLGSLRILRYSLSPVTGLYDAIRDRFPTVIERCKSVFSDPVPEGCTAFTLIRSSSYVFRTGSIRWAMDPATSTEERICEGSKAKLAEVLADADYIFITHGHGDHFDKVLIPMLAETKIHWIIPEFLAEDAENFGLHADRVTYVKAGDMFTAGELSVRVLPGHHIRRSNGKGVRECGYQIETGSGPRMIFPGDTRDYTTDDIPCLPGADYLFLHVWLGDRNGVNLPGCAPYIPDITEFALYQKPKRLILSHLYDCGRKQDAMWRYCHAGMVADRVFESDPSVEVTIPRPGDILYLRRSDEH